MTSSRTTGPGQYDGHPGGAPVLVDVTERIEGASALDAPAAVIQRFVDALLADPQRRQLLHGTWLGHAVHPILTDLPIGFWTSTTVLDLIGGKKSRPAATRLLGLGLAAAVPTALTGWAEWGVAEQREQRVGLVHAGANVAALSLYAASFAARRKGAHRRGVMLGLAGSAAATVGGYLGGHMTSARKVSTRHPAFDEARSPGVAPS
ncbi:MAG TPA: DUF2231 domain-containing protein [Nocardioidaceae bacterium]|nr:DUF2231 domain-containing protein [Nocardioidaceae bacterium]